MQTDIADMGTFVIPMAVAWLAWLELKMRKKASVLPPVNAAHTKNFNPR